MGGPWEDYAAPAAPAQQDGPWADYAPAATPATRTLTVTPDPGTTADLAAAAANGAAFGFGDRIAAAGDTLVNKGLGALGYGPMEGTSPDYAGNLDRYRGVIHGAEERHPYAATAAEIAGGIANPAAIALAPEKLAATLGGKVIQGAGYGAGFGAVHGVAGSQDLTNLPQVAKDAGTGAVFGAGIGGALPAAGQALGAAYRAAAPTLAGKVDGIRGAASGIVSGLMTPEAEARLAALGPDALPVDASRSLQGLGAGVAAIPGRGADLVANTLQERAAGQSGRLLADREAALGPALSPDDVAGALAAKRQTMLPLLAQADTQGQLWNPQLASLAERPAMQDALRTASRTAANEGRPLPSVMLDEQGQQVGQQQVMDAAHAATREAVDNAVGALLGNQGGTLATADGIMAQRAAAADPLYAAARAATIPGDAMPVDLLQRLQRAGALDDAQRTMSLQGRPFDIGNVEAWDLMKRSLDDSAGAAQRGGQKHMASIYTGLKHEVTQAVDAAVPEYAQARQSFAGNSEMLDALNLGQQAAAPGFTREQVARAHTGLGTDGERQMFRLGLGNAFRENLARAGDQSDFASRMAGNQQLRDKLATVAPSQQALAAFNDHIARAQQEFTQAQRPDVRGWRYALDHLDGQAPKTDRAAGAAIGGTRDALRAQLQQIPSFARADQGMQAIDHGQAAFHAGRGVLRDANVFPAPHAAAFDALPLEQQALHRAGARSDLEQQFGSNRNDLSALARALGDENDFGRAKMQTLFGEQARSALIDALDREKTFANSHNRITQASNTGQTREGAAFIKDRTPDDLVPKGSTWAGLIGNTAEKATRAVVGGALKASGERTREDLARILSMSGAELQAHMAKVRGAGGLSRERAAALAAALASPAAIRGAVVATGGQRSSR